MKYPADANQVFWDYTQGTEMRDPTYKEAADYFARLLSWYEKGGFKDEFGKWHESGHHYKIAYWEVLNEIDLEHHWKPAEYTKFYDAVVMAMRAVDTDLKFMAISLAHPSTNPEMFEYFLNPANHKPGVPIDFITYHFYAAPSSRESLDSWQFSFFHQAAGFLNTVRYIEAIRKRLNPSVRTDLNELGIILHEDSTQRNAGYVYKPEPEGYFALAGALYAHLFIETARMGIDVVGESQLIGYPSQYPSVTMIDHNNSQPNARFWVLKMLHDNFAQGDRIYTPSGTGPDVGAQGFDTAKGRKMLVSNRRNAEFDVTLPVEMTDGAVEYVAAKIGDAAPLKEKMSGRTLHLRAFETAVVTVK